MISILNDKKIQNINKLIFEGKVSDALDELEKMEKQQMKTSDEIAVRIIKCQNLIRIGSLKESYKSPV